MEQRGAASAKLGTRGAKVANGKRSAASTRTPRTNGSTGSHAAQPASGAPVDTRQLLVAAKSNELVLWNLPDLASFAPVVNQRQIEAMAFSRDGKLAVTGASNLGPFFSMCRNTRRSAPRAGSWRSLGTRARELGLREVSGSGAGIPPRLEALEGLWRNGRHRTSP